jgi:hypothetical protein
VVGPERLASRRPQRRHRSTTGGLVGRWFAELTRRLLKRSAHKSLKALTADVNHWIATWNNDPRPVVWHKTADEILDTLSGYLKRNS